MTNFKSILRQKNVKILFAFLLLSFLIRIAWIFIYPSDNLSDIQDSRDYDKAAIRFLHGEGIRQGANGRMFAYQPPGYIVFLAIVYFIFGHHIIAVKIVQAILGTFICLISYGLAKRLSNERVALISAFIIAIDTKLIIFSSLIMSECLFTLLFILSILLIYKYIEPLSPVKNGILGGIVLGLSALTREVSLYFIFFIAIWMFINIWQEPGGLRKFRNKLAIFIFSTIIIISPWTIRNYLIFHKFIPIATISGLNVYFGNNPQWEEKGFTWTMPPNTKWADHVNNATTETYIALEYETSKKGLEEGLKYIVKSPIKKTFKTAMRKVSILWLPAYNIPFNDFSFSGVLEKYQLLYYTIILLTAIIGIFFSALDNGKKWSLFYFCFIYLTLLHVVTHSFARYRLPAMPLLIILSAFSIYKIIFILKNRCLETKKGL